MIDYAMWDEFLEQWPVSRVRQMTLQEYSVAGSKDTFTYWLESSLDKYGSIWGGSSFKFGIYSRASNKRVESDKMRSYSDKYGWYTKDGDNPDDAFEVTKARVLEVIDGVTSREIDKIDQVDLGPAYKWKIAYHYQDRSDPLIVAIFQHTALAWLCDEKPNSRNIAHYHHVLCKDRKHGEDLDEYSATFWRKWTQHINPPPIGEDDIPLNTIFYGPPGTGKTYTTINRALKIICRSDEDLKKEIEPLLDDPKADRELLEKRFFQLVDDKRITFLTFHPSYTYEDFVRGIRPILGKKGEVAYEMKDGPFKKLAEAAKSEYALKSSTYDLPEDA
ncbi:MAG: hypothetical protein HN368_00270, partial [Spirochaetales bacterium]|nr:hypothetical protein [Spirochaetales bacterium]